MASINELQSIFKKENPIVNLLRRLFSVGMIDLIYASDFIPSNESATHIQHTFKKKTIHPQRTQSSFPRRFLLIFKIIYFFYIESHKSKKYVEEMNEEKML